MSKQRPLLPGYVPNRELTPPGSPNVDLDEFDVVPRATEPSRVHLRRLMKRAERGEVFDITPYDFSGGKFKQYRKRLRYLIERNRKGQEKQMYSFYVNFLGSTREIKFDADKTLEDFRAHLYNEYGTNKLYITHNGRRFEYMKEKLMHVLKDGAILHAFPIPVKI